MSDLGTVSILVDVRGQPVVRELATDLTNVAAAETKVSAATQRVMEDFRRTREIMANVKRATDDTTASFQRFSARELQQASQRLNGFEKTLANTRRGMGEMGMGIQQVGYQVGDFLVQVQSGTNWMVAFGQQATQLVGVLPAFASSLGVSVGSMLALSTGLGIAIPLVTAIGAYFMRTGEEADKGSGGIMTYAGAIKALTEEIQKNQEEFLKIKFGTESGGVAGASQQVEDLTKKIKDLQANIDRMKSYGGRSAAAAGLLGDPQELEAQKAALEEQLSVLEAQSEAQRMLNGHLSNAKDIVTTETMERARHKAILDQINATENDRKNIFHALAGESESVSKYMDESFQAGLKLSQLDMATPISDAAVQAQILADKLGISVGLAAEIGKIGGMTKDQSKIYSGVKSGALPPAALNSIGMGQTGFSTEGFSSPIQWMGLPPNPTTPRKKSGGGSKTDPMEELRQQIKLQNELLGVPEAQERVLKALGDDRSKYSQKEIDAVTAEIEAYNQKKEAIERTKDIMETVSSSMEDAFMSMVDGTKSAKDAFKSMAAEIIKELYRVLVVQRMVSAISGAFSFASGPSTGSFGLPFGGANASGGSMVTGKSYLVGENGPELVIPRHSGTVVNANQTAAMGGGSGATVVNNNITVTGSDAAMVRTEVAKMIPQITNATKSAIIDAKQRGGQMAAAFR